MPKSASAVGEEEMRALVKGLKDNEELSVTRVRELLKVGYTKARKLLDEAMAGTTYIPPVDVPSSTNDSDVISYIQKLIEEKREVKPDILRRDLNIGYKRAKRLIDSMGGNRAGLTVIPPIARKRRVGKKKKPQTATKAVPKPKAATTRKRRATETEIVIADGADIVVDTNKEERFPKRRRAEKRVPKHIEQVYDDDDEEEENGDGIEEIQDIEEHEYHETDEEQEEEEEEVEEGQEGEEELGSEDERVVEYIVDRRQRKSGVEYLLKWVGLPESENSWSSAADAGCEDLASAFEEQRSHHKDHRKHHRRHSSSNSESSHDEAHHEEPGHDESHAHIMMMFHQQGSHSPDEADRSSHHHGHHHSHHHHSSHHKDGEHGHHEHSHHHHSSHHKDKDVQGHEHGHHHSHHGHHHHSSHHKDKDGHGHHSSHHHSSHHHSHEHKHGHGHSHGHHGHHHSSSHHHHKKSTKIADIISETKQGSESDSTIDSQCCSASDTEHNTQASCDDNCSSVPCDDNCELSPQQTPTITPTTSTISKLVSNEDSLPSITSLFPENLTNTTEVV